MTATPDTQPNKISDAEKNIQLKAFTLRQKIIQEYFSNLNDQQFNAVVAPQKPALVIAGAGTGKTTVLTNRIQYLITFGNAYFSKKFFKSITETDIAALQDFLNTFQKTHAYTPNKLVKKLLQIDPIDPAHILAITFTRKAGNEIKSRLIKKLGPMANEITAGTIHSSCLNILRFAALAVDRNYDFAVYDQKDSKRIIRNLLRQHKDSLANKPKRQNEVMAYIDTQKRYLRTPKMCRQKSKLSFLDEEFLPYYEEYQAILTKENALDFNDLIMNAVFVLQKNPEIRTYFQDKYQYLLVDEYQDTNFAQAVFMNLLASKRQNIYVVGDDDQSIYTFNGADPKIILNFKETYPEANQYTLEQNYRSTKNILNVSNNLILHNQSRMPKQLWTENNTGEHVEILGVDFYSEEGFTICKIIQEQHNNGAPYSDFAVLCRTNKELKPIEQVLLKQKIPYTMKGTQFLSLRVIKDITNYLAVLANPNRDSKLIEVINVPTRGIGSSTQTKLDLYAQEEGVPIFYIVKHATQYIAKGSKGLSKKQAETLEQFANTIENAQKMFQSQSYDKALNQFLFDINYEKQIEALANKKEDQELEAAIREYQEDIQTFIKNFLLPYYQEHAEHSLNEFLQTLNIDALQEGPERPESDSVTLGTIHSVKGLEYQTVFLPIKPDFRNEPHPVPQDEQEEERRVLYVAATRPQEKFYIIIAGQQIPQYVSEMLYGKNSDSIIYRYLIGGVI